jgi:hypothetical protein
MTRSCGTFCASASQISRVRSVEASLTMMISKSSVSFGSTSSARLTARST